MRILVTGGAGFIGSHIATQLLTRGDDVAILDNFVNSSPLVIDRIEAITGRRPEVLTVDLLDLDATTAAFREFTPDAVVHCAGLKSVAESVADPASYYRANLLSTLNVLDAMASTGVEALVFSSSATVYGDADTMPLDESVRTGIGISNPYGRTKHMIEQMLADEASVRTDLRFVALRYFNPIGAHPSGLIGESPTGTPNNLAPFVTQVAIGAREYVTVFGDSYPTPDGTGVRDYIHVMDIADGHLAALDRLRPGFAVYNLGTGQGRSVFDVIRGFEQTVGAPIPYRVAPPRRGDVAVSYADPSKAARELDWTASRSIDEACADAWRWQSMNPDGFAQRS